MMIQNVQTIREQHKQTTTQRATRTIDMYNDLFNVNNNDHIECASTLTQRKNIQYNVAINLKHVCVNNDNYFIFTSCDTMRTISNVSLYHVDDTTNVCKLCYRSKTSSIIDIFEHVRALNIIDAQYDVDKMQRTFSYYRSFALKQFIDTQNSTQTTNDEQQ